VTLPASERAGILTRAAFLATAADADLGNPVRRGYMVLRRVLCQELPVPDNVLVPPLPDPVPGATRRERFEAHGKLECAVKCHSLIDPVGFAFENYDAIGAYGTTELGQPIDAHGALTLPSGETFKFDNAIQFMGQLVQSEQVRRCLGTQWLRYMLRRHEIDSEAPTQAALYEVFRTSGWNLRELMLALPLTRSFTHRTPSPGEVMP
jgi:hypothetical protein